jgi:hypothetical protein
VVIFRSGRLNPGVARALAPALLVLAGAGSPAWAGTLSAQEGLARLLDGGALVHREQHLLRAAAGRPLERLVVYRCPGGAAFARKRLDYVVSALAPAFQLDDGRSGYREGMRRREGRAELYFRAPGSEAEQRKAFAAAPRVVDAGFDEFVRSHWAELLGGRSLPMQFAVPSRLRAMEFSVRKSGATRIAGEEALVFRLRLDGWLGLVAPHIDVAYGARSRRLLRFEGLSNMRDARGQRQLDLRIEFPLPPRPVDESQWQAALAEPLATGCGSGQRADTAGTRTPVGST